MAVGSQVLAGTPGEASIETMKPKIPRRKRGIIRVETLLNAASDAFVEKGFDAATMTEIAERAGASIGSLYQFFPTKDVLADVLRARFGDSVCAKLNALRESDEGRTGKDLAACIFRINAEALKFHPYFTVLLVVRNNAGSSVAKVRKHYADALTKLLQSRMPNRTPAMLRASMIVVREILRCEVDIEAEPNSREKTMARTELELMLSDYLTNRMTETAPEKTTDPAGPGRAEKKTRRSKAQ